MQIVKRNEYLEKVRSFERQRRIYDGKAADVGSEGHDYGSLFQEEAPSIETAPYEIPNVVSYPERIIIPGMDRKKYQKLAMNYAESVDVTKSPLFSLLDETFFDIVDQGFKGNGYVRVDLEFYLNELLSLCSSSLGLKKLTIGSSYRTKKINDQIYRDAQQAIPETGPHIGGLAVDICAQGEARYIIADHAWEMGFGGIAIGNTFVHIDIAPKSYWNYGNIGTYKNPKDRGD